MAKYRIIEHDFTTHKSYEAQVKSWLGFWKNIHPEDGYGEGYFESLEAAEQDIIISSTKLKSKVVRVFEL